MENTPVFVAGENAGPGSTGKYFESTSKKKQSKYIGSRPSTDRKVLWLIARNFDWRKKAFLNIGKKNSLIIYEKERYKYIAAALDKIDGLKMVQINKLPS